MTASNVKVASNKAGNVVDMFDGKSTSEVISSTHTQEVVIALCGPIGSPLRNVGKAIHATLTDSFGYTECNHIRLSEFINEHSKSIGVPIPDGPIFDRITAQINAGNQLREKYGTGILAELAVDRIRFDRERHKVANADTRYAPRRVCHIIDSIKNKEELALLKLVYRDMIYVVGVFAPMHLRESYLKGLGMNAPEIYRLIDRDSGEEFESGQTVTDTFPNCDFFLRADHGTDSELNKRVERFLHLILGTKVITPTLSETAMYAAAMASANSACLSRQVGAAVTDDQGEVLSIGWNDVPKVGGGLYGESNDDHRCWNIDNGKCFNDDEKDMFAQELVSVLHSIIPVDQLSVAKGMIKESSKLRGLIEFSRAIHAEMHAIINAAKASGSRLIKGKLYVTTYPCHSCARHIIAAGISEVYYIEPYRKSLAVKLHGDAISEQDLDTQKVRILAYEGVAPSRYLALFKVPPNSRKKDGKMIRIALKDAFPRLEKSMEALPALEGIVVTSLRSKNLLPVKGTDNEKAPDTPAT